MTGTMEINRIQKCMDNDKPVTITQGPIGKDVKASGLNETK